MADSAHQPRDSAGRFKSSQLDPKSTSNLGPEPPAVSAVQHQAMTEEEYNEELKAATALKDALDRERAHQEIMRVGVTDEEVLTMLTVAMMAKFTIVWADTKLLCSDSPDCMRRLPEILQWLERVVPRARNLARRMFDIACYVDWRVRGKLSDILRFDPGRMRAKNVH